MQQQLDTQDFNFDLTKKGSIKEAELTSMENVRHDDYQSHPKNEVNDQRDEIKL